METIIVPHLAPFFWGITHRRAALRCTQEIPHHSLLGPRQDSHHAVQKIHLPCSSPAYVLSVSARCRHNYRKNIYRLWSTRALSDEPGCFAIFQHADQYMGLLSRSPATVYCLKVTRGRYCKHGSRVECLKCLLHYHQENMETG